MTIAEAIAKMVDFYGGSLHEVEHFLKVWGYAKTIGELENLDEYTQRTLELTAVIHDIGCPISREKYGSAAGPYQEKEGAVLALEFYKNAGLPVSQLERISFLVGHHHTYTDVDGLDYQILLEADYLVNAAGSKDNKDGIKAFRDKVFKTESGIRLLNSIYNLN